MSSDFINGLVATANPVKRRRGGLEALAVLGVAALELIGLAYFFDPHILAAAYDAAPVAMTAKIGVFGLLALAGMALAIHSFDPAAQRVGQWTMGAVGAAFVIAVLFFDWQVGPSLQSTIKPFIGMNCARSVTIFALPVTVLLFVLMRQGASTQPKRSAFLAGLAGGSFGAFIYALQCPFTSFYYLMLWYGGSVAVVAILSMLVMPRFVKW